MANYGKLLLFAVTVAAMLALAVGSASANRLSVRSRSFALIWSTLSFSGGESIRVSCRVTLAGSFHSTTITKTARSLIGLVTTASVGTRETCTGGSARALTATLPWHVTYNSFTGTLPRISGVKLNLIGASFEIVTEVGTCLARTETNRPATGTATVEAGGVVTGFRADETLTIPLTGSFFCSLVTGSLSGTAVARSDNVDWRRDADTRDGDTLRLTLI
jgi:hypothetical protein